MDLSSAEGFRTQVPKEAWTGRAWWQVFCGGCCLVMVLLAIAAALLSSWYVSAPEKKKDIWRMPQRTWEFVKTKWPL
ncbi:MAG: hypothetical protein Q7N87_04385 [Candidatus Uhrbacteria bacterium]|nr:hypothetical protein [Candidatus Uhrbacteria bacterium]